MEGCYSTRQRAEIRHGKEGYAVSDNKSIPTQHQIDAITLVLSGLNQAIEPPAEIAARLCFAVVHPLECIRQELSASSALLEITGERQRILDLLRESERGKSHEESSVPVSASSP